MISTEKIDYILFFMILTFLIRDINIQSCDSFEVDEREKEQKKNKKITI